MTMPGRGGGTTDRKVSPDVSSARIPYRPQWHCCGDFIHQYTKPGKPNQNPCCNSKENASSVFPLCVSACAVIPKLKSLRAPRHVSGPTHQIPCSHGRPSWPLLQDKISVFLKFFFTESSCRNYGVSAGKAHKDSRRILCFFL